MTSDEAQELVEYGLLALSIAIGATLATGALGQTIASVLWQPIAAGF